MAKAIVTAESNIGEKKTRKPREKKLPSLNIGEILSISSKMPIDEAAALVKQLKTQVEERAGRIRELLKSTEGL